jgi:XapX domain-containing protein
MTTNPESPIPAPEPAIYSPGGTAVLKIAIGLALGFLIGAGCRWFDVPTPSPPTLIGACLVVSMTLGYVTADRMLASGSGAPRSISEHRGDR